MKKSLFLFSAILMFFFYSCDNELSHTGEIIVNKQNLNMGRMNKSNDNIDLGKLHNQVLTKYYNDFNQSSSNVSTEEFVDDLYSINKTIYPKTFNDENYNLNKNLIINIIGTENLNDFDYFERIPVLINQLIDNKVVSETFAYFLEEIATTLYSKEELFERIKQFKAKNTLTIFEIKLLDNFKNVYQYSDMFWTSIEAENRRPCPSWVIRAADATGTVLGATGGFGVGGPFGSIIAGAIAGQAMSGAVEVTGCK